MNSWINPPRKADDPTSKISFSATLTPLFDTSCKTRHNGHMTRLCVPIMLEPHQPDDAAPPPTKSIEVAVDRALELTEQAQQQGADIVEFRIDAVADEFLEYPDALTRLISDAVLPCIITCRASFEGGEFDGDDQARISLLEHAGPLGGGSQQPTYIDLELTTYQRSANLRQKVGFVVDHDQQQRPVTTGLILSTHDFEQRPADLLKRIAAMAEQPACRVIKAAWMARSLRDNIEAFELIQQNIKPTIALCMGEAGLPSRVLAKKFGALLTFAALDSKLGTAPGQPSVQELKTLYRWDHQTPDTQVFGVIGHPVGHSMSPAIHNAGFDTTGFNGVYLPMPIAPSYESFKATVGDWLAFKNLDFRGASVTIPHKENLLRFVEDMGGEIEPLSAEIGAANTLVVRDDDSLYACNSDYAAALDAVCDGMGIKREELADKRVAVIGAGGAARAIVAGFAEYGATVVIYNRTRSKADALADEMNSKNKAGKVVAADMAKLCDSCCEIYINCTPIGMHPNVDATPMPEPKFEPGTVVFDTIYNPVETLLLRDAKQAGCVTVPGTEMFVRQAAVQFEHWTQQSAPLDTFRQVMNDKLKTV